MYLEAARSGIHSSTKWSGGVDEQDSYKKNKSYVEDCGSTSFILVEAVKIVYYVVNQSPSTAIRMKTPMEMWIGKPVYYSHLQALGCPMYVMYNSQKRAKLDAKSRRCIFLGYADKIKGYHLWDPTAHKIIRSRDVIFVEDQL